MSETVGIFIFLGLILSIIGYGIYLHYRLDKAKKEILTNRSTNIAVTAIKMALDSCHEKSIKVFRTPRFEEVTFSSWKLVHYFGLGEKREVVISKNNKDIQMSPYYSEFLFELAKKKAA